MDLASAPGSPDLCRGLQIPIPHAGLRDPLPATPHRASIPRVAVAHRIPAPQQAPRRGPSPTPHVRTGGILLPADPGHGWKPLYPQPPHHPLPRGVQHLKVPFSKHSHGKPHTKGPGRDPRAPFRKVHPLPQPPSPCLQAGALPFNGGHESNQETIPQGAARAWPAGILSLSDTPWVAELSTGHRLTDGARRMMP